MKNMTGILSFLATIWIISGPFFQAQGRPVRFADIGEGYTSEAVSGGLQVSWRQFSAPDLERVCASSSIPDQLLAREDYMNLRVGEILSFDSLHVTSLDSTGEPLGPIPITVGIEEKTPPILDLEAYRHSVGPIAVVGAGEFLLRVRPLCLDSGEPNQTIFIRYSVSF